MRERFDRRVIAQQLLVPMIGALLLISCRSEEKKISDPLFEALGPDRTGLNVSNTLHYDQAFNLFKYIYFYNGSGVGAADFNNDGRTDLFFGGNQTDDHLFLNRGDLRFEDVSAAASIPRDSGWTTGVSVVDINQDGLLDIYVCRVGNYEILHGHNLLLINQGNNPEGIPVFEEQSVRYGLDFSGFSTQAVFFDYDLDGDLDLFLLNHSVHENGTFRPRQDFMGTSHLLAGDRFFFRIRTESLWIIHCRRVSTVRRSGTDWVLLFPISIWMAIPICILGMIFMRMIICTSTNEMEVSGKRRPAGYSTAVSIQWEWMLPTPIMMAGRKSFPWICCRKIR